MRRLILWNWLLILGLWLVGCDLVRDNQVGNDIENFVPPTGAAAPTETVVITQDGVVVRLEPATPQVNIGDVFDVAIRIDNATNLAGADVQLLFNPAVLQVRDADPGAEGTQIQPGDFLVPYFIATNVVSNTTGNIQYAVVQLPATSPVSGNGWLATITFQAIAPGTSPLDFTQAILANDLAQPIPATTQSGQVTAGQGPTSTPTHTPVPGQATATFTSTPIPGTPTFTSTPLPGTPTFTPSPTLIAATSTPTPTSTPLPTPTPTPTATNTPAAPAVEIPPGATVGFCYRVQPGETLYSLGQKFNVDPHFIFVVNDIYPPGNVFPQQVLFIPQQYGTGPNVYIVQPGDTLKLIADQCRLPADFLAAVNGLPENANISVGSTLIIPRPPYAPPSRYPYPGSVWPPACPPSCK